MPPVLRNGPRAGLALATLLLAACATHPAAEPATQATEQPVASDAADKDLTAALMAGEFAWQDGRGSAAAKHFLRAAKLSGDAKVAEHATRIALVSKEFELAEEAVARWRELDGKALGGKTCLDFGSSDKAGLACAADCSFDTSKCTAFCGDGKKASTEPSFIFSAAWLGLRYSGVMSFSPTSASGSSSLRCARWHISVPPLRCGW